MIGRLAGTLAESRPDLVLIDVSGVGYEVSVPLSTHTRLPAIGERVSLRIYTLVREDALQLFGFGTPEEKALFERLLTVSGIGPKLALAILSGISPRNLVEAVSTKNTALLSTVSGVGKKLAERMALELKDKLGSLTFSGEPPPHVSTSGLTSPASLDAAAILINLGYKPPQAEAAVKAAAQAVPPDDLEALVQTALRSLAR